MGRQWHVICNLERAEEEEWSELANHQTVRNVYACARAMNRLRLVAYKRKPTFSRLSVVAILLLSNA